MSKEENKLKLLGLISSLSVGDIPNYDALAEELGESKTTVIAWASKIRRKQKDGQVLDMIDVESIMMDKVADEVKQMLQLDPISGEVNLVDVEKEDSTEVLTERIEKFRGSVKGLELLNEDLQSTASLLSARIGVLLLESEVHPKDLASLANALTSIQVAFFNKPTTTVNVGVGIGNEGLSKFRAELKN